MTLEEINFPQYTTDIVTSSVVAINEEYYIARFYWVGLGPDATYAWSPLVDVEICSLNERNTFTAANQNDRIIIGLIGLSHNYYYNITNSTSAETVTKYTKFRNIIVKKTDTIYFDLGHGGGAGGSLGEYCILLKQLTRGTDNASVEEITIKKCNLWKFLTEGC